MLRFIILSLVTFCGFGCSQPITPGTSTTEKGIQVPALLERNEKLRQGKEWDEVQNYYATQRAEIQAKPTQYEAYVRLSEVYINEARITGEHPYYYPAALSILEPVTSGLTAKSNLNPQEKDQLFRALSNKASVQLSLHDFSNALITAKQAIAINLYNAQIYGAMVDAHVELGQYADAVAMADKMVSIRPDLRSYSRISYLREIHGDIGGAIDAMDMAVKAGYPGAEQTEWTRLQLGGLYERYGNLDLAMEQYQNCLAARPNYPFALEALAGLDIENKKYEAAIEKLNQAISIIPEVGYYSKLAELYTLTGNQVEAEKLKPEILTMIKEDIDKGHDMSLELAAIYTDVYPDYPKALEYALKEYKNRPDNIDVNRQLALIYGAMGNKSAANEHYEKALKTKSQHPELKKIKKML